MLKIQAVRKIKNGRVQMRSQTWGLGGILPFVFAAALFLLDGSAGAQGPDSWSLIGNSGIDPTKNFLGTTDDQPLVIRTGPNVGTERLRVGADGAITIATDNQPLVIRTGPNGGAERLRVDADGSVAIATGNQPLVIRSGPNVGTERLRVDANGTVIANDNQPLVIRTGPDGGTERLRVGADGAITIATDDQPLVIKTGPNGGMERLRVDADGNVAIGLATLPGQFGQPLQSKLLIGSGFDTDALVFTRSPPDHHSISTSFHGEVPKFNYLGFNVEHKSNDIRRVLTLQGDGNVGIGTSAPGAKLVLDRQFNESRDVTSLLIRHNGDSPISPAFVLQNDQGGEIKQIFLFGQNSEAGGLGPSREAGSIIANWHGLTIKSEKEVKIDSGSDLAEPFAMDRDAAVQPGMVVAIDPIHPGQLRLADHAYDRTVAGIVAGAGGIKSGLTLTSDRDAANAKPVALSGRVYAWADAKNGPIQPGDLLTTGDTPGHVMRVTDYARAQGAVLGKAMSTLPEGTGLVLVLVSLQ